jgi:hypothetical protein
LRRIDSIETVLSTTKVTSDLDVFTLLENAIGLLLTETEDHAGDTLSGARADKARCSRALQGLKSHQGLLPKESVKDGLGLKAQELFGAQSTGQHGYTVVVLVASNLILILSCGF